MKIFISLLITMIMSFSNVYSQEKRDCSIYKKISKNYVACKAGNLKKGTVNTAGKLKKGTGNIFKNIFKKN